MSEYEEKEIKEIERITIERCCQFCRDSGFWKETTILPSEWRCKYHRFLQSIEMRKTSVKRPRLVIEVVSKTTAAIIVAIGERYSEKALLPSDLEYVVIRKADYGFPIVYDARTKKIYIISGISEEKVIENRLRSDFWLAVSKGEYYKIKKSEILDEVESHIARYDKNEIWGLTTEKLIEKVAGRKITQK
jgi:hypothetical protein